MSRDGDRHRIIGRIEAFIHHESAGGLMLIAAAVLAILLGNSRLGWLYDDILATPVTVRIGELGLDKPLVLWINDGLMAIFFFLVGLELKREVVEGELANRQQALLPGIAAFGGMLMPALIYAAVNRNDPVALGGWAIPAATDIAFAMCVLALLGRRVPSGLKVFLLALAILDDLGSIIVIALFYTGKLSYLSLGLAAACIAVLVALNRAGVVRIAPYVLVGLAMWLFVLQSGVHATLAGVVTALTVPLRGAGDADVREGPLHRLVEALHPWVAFAILPLFAFANAGVSLAGLTPDRLLEPIPLGIALGLVVGKQIGVFVFAVVAIRAGIGRLPQGTNWLQLYGVSLIAGIGFTMSLFIGTLAFPGGEQMGAVRAGVLSGSVVSAVLGYLVLWFAAAPRRAPGSEGTPA